MKIQSLQNLLEPVLEPLIRRVVREEVELALRKHLNNFKRATGKEIYYCSPESRSLQIQFLNNISLPVFTGARIEGEDSLPIKLAIVDVLTGQIVNSGPEASARIEILVLEGDFDSDEGDNWTIEDFKNNIVRERDGKKPLLTGEAFFTLKEGIGSVGDISFTDNSSWTRSRRFKLGARVVDNANEITVREAKTESFIVRDHRGELYKKHHPPALLDEVWRLEKIGKDGAFHKRLSRENIKTVKDFLTLLVLDPPRLRHILGTGMSTKMWEITVDHARTCVVDKRMYVYYHPGSHHKSGVVFNVVGQVIGVLSECHFVPADKLSETEKADALRSVISAFQNWEEVVCFDDEASLMSGSSLLTNVLQSSSSPGVENSSGNNFQKMVGFDYTQPSPDIISSIYSVGSMSGLDDFAMHCIDNMDLSFPSQVTNSMICDTESISRAFCDEDHLPYFDSDLQSPNLSLESQADLHSAVSGFLLPRPVDKAQRRWKKLFSVLKFFSIRRVVALKKNRIREIPRHSNGM
ncbi:hypothetical protein ACFE04_028263 [Oxalis oulophora]